MRRRLLLTALPIIAAVPLWAARADAHAEFVGAPASVANGSTVALVMNVPHERDDATWNVGVSVALPPGWTAVGCETKPTWGCTTGADGARAVVRFTKEAGAAPAEDETFRFTVRAGGAAGAAAFPTVQTYSSGEVVRWIEGPGSALPAATLQVTGEAPAETVPPTAAPATTPATTVAPAPTAASPETTGTTAAPTTVAATTTTAPPATTVAATTSTPAPSNAPTSLAAGTTTSTGPSATVAATATTTDDDGGGGSGGVVLVVVVLLVAAATTTLVMQRRRAAG